MGRKVPEPVEHAVASLVKKGYSREEAYRIIVGRWQKLGYLKKGTLDCTKKCKSKMSKHYKEPLKARCRKINLARKNKISCTKLAIQKLRRRKHNGSSTKKKKTS